jgi:hypothetical protein
MKPNIYCDPIPWLALIAETQLHRGTAKRHSAVHSPSPKVHESVIKVNVAQLPVTLN